MSLKLKEQARKWGKHRGPINKAMYEIPGFEEFDYDTVKADVLVGGKPQKIDFGVKLTNPIFDLSDQITWRLGRPTWDSLVRATESLAKGELADIKQERE